MTNLRIDDTVTLPEKWNIHGIIWCEGPHTSSGHYMCTFKADD